MPTDINALRTIMSLQWNARRQYDARRCAKFFTFTPSADWCKNCWQPLKSILKSVQITQHHRRQTECYNIITQTVITWNLCFSRKTWTKNVNGTHRMLWRMLWLHKFCSSMKNVKMRRVRVNNDLYGNEKHFLYRNRNQILRHTTLITTMHLYR